MKSVFTVLSHNSSLDSSHFLILGTFLLIVDLTRKQETDTAQNSTPSAENHNTFSTIFKHKEKSFFLQS